MTLTHNQKILLGNGGLYAMYDGLTAAFIVAYALFLGASNTMVGVVGAIPYVAILASQLPGFLLTHRFSRRAIYLFTTTFGRLAWGFILAIPLIVNDHPLLWLVGIHFVGRFFESLADPSWTTLAADVVPEKVRGQYFSRRMFTVGILSMMAFLAGGFILDLFPKSSHAGFTIIFSLGIILGLLATGIMSKIREPATRCHQTHSFRDLTKDWSGDFGKFLLFSCVFNFGYMLASPFFNAYMLEDLGLSYSLFVIANSLSFVAKIFAQSVFGPMSDKNGDKPIAMMCIFGTGLIPFLFLFINQSTLWLLIPVQILSGIVWGGVDLAMFNLLLDLTGKDDRPFQVAEYQSISSIPLILGPIVGGLLADKAMFLGLAGLPLIFALSAFLRCASVFFLAPVPERRGPAEVPVWVVVREFMGILTVKGVHHQVMEVRKWVSTK